MYSAAPRWSEARSSRRTPDCCRLPPSLAKASEAANMPAASTAAWPARTKKLVMHRHPFRHRLGPIELGPDRHRDEENEVEERQHAADDRLGRVGTRATADLAEPQEAHRQHQQHRP